MGAPELPNDPGHEDLHATHIVHHPTTSDDSDDESLIGGDTYEGYQPLAMDDHQSDYRHMHPNVTDDSNRNYYNADGFNRTQESMNIDENNVTEVINSNTNMPYIRTADVEIEREVWTQPRPRELQIELDVDKTQQILSAMANFQLPNLAIPAWADGIPEEHWKQELLLRIRQREFVDNDSKFVANKDSK